MIKKSWNVVWWGRGREASQRSEEWVRGVRRGEGVRHVCQLTSIHSTDHLNPSPLININSRCCSNNLSKNVRHRGRITRVKGRQDRGQRGRNDRQEGDKGGKERSGDSYGSAMSEAKSGARSEGRRAVRGAKR